MFRSATRHTVGLRSYSSQAARAQSILSSFAVKSSAAARTGIYYTKVFGELAKYVWVKEGLSPPTVQELQTTFVTESKNYYKKFLDAAKDPSKSLSTLQTFKSSDYIKGGAVIVQLLGLFSLGEIIGRRHVYGYKDHTPEH